MTVLIEVQWDAVVRYEWFLDRDAQQPFEARLNQWKDERGVPKDEQVSARSHRWYMIHVDPTDSHPRHFVDETCIATEARSYDANSFHSGDKTLVLMAEIKEHRLCSSVCWVGPHDEITEAVAELRLEEMMAGDHKAAGFKMTKHYFWLRLHVTTEISEAQLDTVKHDVDFDSIMDARWESPRWTNTQECDD